MKARALLLLALALAGCVVGPRLDTPAADPDAPAATGAPMPRTLGADATTRKTDELLAAVGADKLDGLKPMKMDAMEGMDHSKMPGMKGGGDMQGMDHSKMPGMKSGSGMQGMDHSKMPGMGGKPGADQAKPQSTETPGMDHSKMPGMKPGTPAAPERAAPGDKAATAEEMKKTADEMKKAADEMKAKSDALKKNRKAMPSATPAPKAGDHSQHQP